MENQWDDGKENNHWNGTTNLIKNTTIQQMVGENTQKERFNKKVTFNDIWRLCLMFTVGGAIKVI